MYLKLVWTFFSSVLEHTTSATSLEIGVLMYEIIIQLELHVFE